MRSHQARWKDLSDGKPPLMQAQLALNGKFVEMQGDRRREYPMGLGKKALEILSAIPLDSLKEGEHFNVMLAQMELMLKSGNADKVAEAIREETMRNRLGPLFLANYQILAGGALGDFAMLDEGAATLEKQLRAEAQEYIKGLPQGILFGTFLSPEEHIVATVAFHTVIRLDRLQERQKELCNIMTLRGIAALESGDTAKARAIFAAIFTEAGADLQFSERPIAVRYRDLLNEQQWNK